MIRTMSVLSSETTEARQKWNSIFTETKKENCSLYLGKMFFKNESKLKAFSYRQNLRDLLPVDPHYKIYYGGVFQVKMK